MQNVEQEYVYSIVYSQAVTHPSTNTTRCCLTSVIGRELVLSTWYGRRHLCLIKFAPPIKTCVGADPRLLSLTCLVTLVTKVLPHIWQNVYNIVYSHAVTHPSTNTTRCCLTSVIGRELVLSTWYGRRQIQLVKFACHTKLVRSMLKAGISCLVATWR